MFPALSSASNTILMSVVLLSLSFIALVSTVKLKSSGLLSSASSCAVTQFPPSFFSTRYFTLFTPDFSSRNSPLKTGLPFSLFPLTTGLAL